MTPLDTPDGFYSWEIIGTYAGATAATVLVSEFIKKPLWRVLPMVPPEVWVYVVAFGLLLGADEFTPPQPTFASMSLCFINAFGVAITAMGAFDKMRGYFLKAEADEREQPK